MRAGDPPGLIALHWRLCSRDRVVKELGGSSESALAVDISAFLRLTFVLPILAAVSVSM